MSAQPPEPTPVHADVTPVVVHWGTVGREEPVPPRPPRQGRGRIGAVVGVVAAVLALALVGGLVLVQEDNGAETVAQDYVSALQRLDCADVAALAADEMTGGAECRFLRFRASRGDGAYGLARRVRESQFELVSVQEDAREAQARFDVQWDGDTAEAYLDLRRDEQARWRVITFRVDDRDRDD